MTLTNREAGELLNEVYTGVTGFVKVDEEKRPHNVDYTYGELTNPGATALLSRVTLSDADVLYDLGCGIGKFVLQAFLTTRVREAVGIEFEPQRYTAAVQAKGRLLATCKPSMLAGRDLKFCRADFTTCDLSDATVVYVCSTCMPESVLSEIARKLTGAHRLRHIVSLKPSSSFANLLSNVTQISLETTWTKSTIAHVYSRSHPEKKTGGRKPKKSRLHRSRKLKRKDK